MSDVAHRCGKHFMHKKNAQYLSKKNTQTTKTFHELACESSKHVVVLF